MNHRHALLACTTLLWATSLCGCEEETLSVGAQRCRGVSCEPHEVEPPRIMRDNADTYTRREQVTVAVGVPWPCPKDAVRCNHNVKAMELVERDGKASLLIAGAKHALFPGDEPDTVTLGPTRLWVGRYEEGAFGGADELDFAPSAGAPSQPTGGFDGALLLAPDRDEPGEALVIVADPPIHDGVLYRSLRVFRFDGRDELRPLFEEASGPRIADAAMLDGDLLLAGVVGENPELTRYAPDGSVRWRQTALRTEGWEIINREIGREATVAVEVLGDDRIVVVVSNGNFGSYEVLVLSDAGDKLWGYQTGSGGHLATDGDTIVVGGGGYTVERIERRDGEIETTSAGRVREQYYELTMAGFDVAPSGWAYFGLQDGDKDAPVELIERVSPDSKVIDSIPVKSSDAEQCRSALGDVIRVDPSEERAFVSNRFCLAEIALPPLPQ